MVLVFVWDWRDVLFFVSYLFDILYFFLRFFVDLLFLFWSKLFWKFIDFLIFGLFVLEVIVVKGFIMFWFFFFLLIFLLLFFFVFFLGFMDRECFFGIILGDFFEWILFFKFLFELVFELLSIILESIELFLFRFVLFFFILSLLYLVFRNTLFVFFILNFFSFFDVRNWFCRFLFFSLMFRLRGIGGFSESFLNNSVLLTEDFLEFFGFIIILFFSVFYFYY